MATAIAAAFRRATAFDVRNYLRPAMADAFEHDIVVPIAGTLTDAIAQIGELERVIDGQDVGSGNWDALEPTQVDSPPVAELLANELWQHVADVCFAARSDLRRVERMLRHHETSHEDRIASVESSIRKLRRALAALLAALGRALDRTFPVIAEMSAELDSAIAVRRLYARFRRSLAACDRSDPSSVRRALRYAAVSFAVMVGHSDFAEVRVADRVQILGLQKRILRWARDGSSDDAGYALYLDIVTAADLLRSINLRQELAAHDRELLREVGVALAETDPKVAIAAALPALHRLHGRDDALDVVIATVLREPPTAALVQALRAALEPSPE